MSLTRDRRRWLLCAALLPSALVLPPRMRSGDPNGRGPQDPAGTSVGDSAKHFGEILRAHPAESERELAARLSASGPLAVVGALELLGGPEAADVKARRIALLVLERNPTAMRARLAEKARLPDVAERSLVLDVVAELGDGRDVELAIDAARPQEEGDEEGLASELENCIERIVRRDPTAAARTAAVFDEAADALEPPLLHGLGSSGVREALLALASIADGHSASRSYALAELTRIAASLQPPFDERAVDVVRRALADAEPGFRRQAVLAAGRLEDAGSVPALIELLAAEHGGVRTEALWSLRRITGMRLGSEPARWRAWHDREQTWWTDRAAAELHAIDSGDPASRASVFNDFGRHRLRRHELAAELARRLPGFDEASLRLAARTLEQLRSTVAVPALIECLDRPAAEDRLAACRALRVLTGKELPASRDAWELETR